MEQRERGRGVRRRLVERWKKTKSHGLATSPEPWWSKNATGSVRYPVRILCPGDPSGVGNTAGGWAGGGAFLRDPRDRPGQREREDERESSTERRARDRRCARGAARGGSRRPAYPRFFSETDRTTSGKDNIGPAKGKVRVSRGARSRRTVRSRFPKRTAERAEKACSWKTRGGRGQRSFDASRGRANPVSRMHRLVNKTIVRASNGSNGTARKTRTSDDRAFVTDQSSEYTCVECAARADPSARARYPRARATRGNDDVDGRVLRWEHEHQPGRAPSSRRRWSSSPQRG